MIFFIVIRRIFSGKNSSIWYDPIILQFLNFKIIRIRKNGVFHEKFWYIHIWYKISNIFIFFEKRGLEFLSECSISHLKPEPTVWDRIKLNSKACFSLIHYRKCVRLVSVYRVCQIFECQYEFCGTLFWVYSSCLLNSFISDKLFMKSWINSYINRITLLLYMAIFQRIIENNTEIWSTSSIFFKSFS